MRALVLWLILALSGCAEAGNEAFRETLEKRLKKTFPGVEVTAVEEAPMDGMLAVELDGRDRVYVTGDGRYMFAGRTFELSDQGATDLREQRLQEVRREGLGEIDLARAITFAADDTRAEVYVFTDVTCGYCRRFHQSIDAINAKGITVHYLAFPRGGMGGQGAPLMRQVWCAGDRQAALTEAKAEGRLEQMPEECDDPVQEQYRMGQKFGVRGTPSIYTPEGEKVGGYLPPDELARALGVGETEAEEGGNSEN